MRTTTQDDFKELISNEIKIYSNDNSLCWCKAVEIKVEIS